MVWKGVEGRGRGCGRGCGRASKGEAADLGADGALAALDDNLKAIGEVLHLVRERSREIGRAQDAAQRAHADKIVLRVLRVAQQRLDGLEADGKVVRGDLADDVHEHVAALEQPRQPHRAPGRLSRKELLNDEAEQVHRLLPRVRSRRHPRDERAHRVVHEGVPLLHLVDLAGGPPPFGVERLADDRRGERVASREQSQHAAERRARELVLIGVLGEHQAQQAHLQAACARHGAVSAVEGAR